MYRDKEIMMYNDTMGIKKLVDLGTRNGYLAVFGLFSRCCLMYKFIMNY